MNLFIFKTNIKSKSKAALVRSRLRYHPNITECTVDTEDVDGVLRVKVARDLQVTEIQRLVNEYGFHCEELQD